MSNPIRIQRKRIKDWKMPANTVYVGRPSTFGNPFKISGDMIYGNASYRRKILSPWIYIEPDNNTFLDREKLSLHEAVIKLYENWLAGKDNNYINPPPSIEKIKEQLKGKNLACWCALDQPCHADVLLKIANE